MGTANNNLVRVCATKYNPQGKADNGCLVPDPSSYKFDSAYTLNNSAGEITFKGRCREVYIRLNNEMNNDTHQYWVIINGFNNSQSRNTRGDGSVVCQPRVAALDENKSNE
jgi:hypothetical protein